MKFIIGLIVIATLSGCGKKVEDPGPQFALDLSATQESLKDGLITREDENSGPSYSLNSSNLKSIEYIDKKLICSAGTLDAKRTLNADVGFQTFKISEAEFHGLNLLPQQPKCILQLKAANGTGSTVTKNIPILLKFNSNPNPNSLQISRSIAGIGRYSSNTFANPSQFALDSYEIKNSLPYDVAFFFNANFSAQVYGEFSTDASLLKTCPNSSEELRISKIVFDPPTVEYSGDISEGYLFKVKAGQSVKLVALTNIPWGGTISHKTIYGDYRLTTLSVSRYSSLGQLPLYQATDFEIKPHDPQSMTPVTYSRVTPYDYVQPYNMAGDPAVNGCRLNPNL